MKTLLAVRSIAETGENVFSCEARKVPENFFLSHIGSKIFQHIEDGDAHSANARLAAALSRLDCDDILITQCRDGC